MDRLKYPRPCSNDQSHAAVREVDVYVKYRPLDSNQCQVPIVLKSIISPTHDISASC